MNRGGGAASVISVSTAWCTLMVSRKTALQYNDGPSPPGEDTQEQLVIARSAEPRVQLANILIVAGALAAQWGEEILLHLRVASLWLRLGKKGEAIRYLRALADLHAIDAFRLDHHGARRCLDMMRYFLDQVGLNENLLYSEKHRKKRRVAAILTSLNLVALVKKLISALRAAEYDRPLLSHLEEDAISEIVKPRTTWLEHAYLTPVPGETRYLLAQELYGIKEYADPDISAQQLLTLFDHCRHWHERKADTPIWVHELDDVGTRAVYLAVMIDRPQVIATYIERCIDALNDRPLALMPSVAVAVGGLGYIARRFRRDELLYKALDFLPRLPEHERCIAALTLAEVLMERETRI